MIWFLLFREGGLEKEPQQIWNFPYCHPLPPKKTDEFSAFLKYNSGIYIISSHWHFNNKIVREESKNSKNSSNILRQWFKLTNHPLPQHMENAICLVFFKSSYCCLVLLQQRCHLCIVFETSFIVNKFMNYILTKNGIELYFCILGWLHTLEIKMNFEIYG